MSDDDKVITVEGEELQKLKEFAYGELEKMRPPDGTPALAADPTPFAVICRGHGQVFMTNDEYSRQLCRPDARWTCPKCGEIASFDDDNYEAGLEE